MNEFRATLPEVREQAWIAVRRLEAIPTWRVLGGVVVLQWVLVLGLALVVRHNGWIYYQGGDQLWYYTTSWLLVHGHFPQPGVGPVWPVAIAPVAAFTGPNIANAYPAIIVVQVVFLLPLAPLALYGIGRRLGGRLFGYWAAALWLVVPLVAIWYTDAGYHERFTEALLPQGFGLTAMGDFPAMIAALLSAYFLTRALCDEPGERLDSFIAGVAAGATVGIKSSTALFLVGPALAFIVARKPRAALVFTAGLVPAVVTLAVVKWRGYGYVPLFHASGGTRVAASNGAVAALGGLHNYLPWHWHTFVTQLDLVREHFWSARLVEWLVVAGAIGVCIRSRRLGALIVGWFAAIVILKTGSGRGDMEGGNLLRLLMPAYPAFILMLASLVFLVPGVARKQVLPAAPRRFLTPYRRGTLVGATLLLTAAIPLAAYGAASPDRGPNPRAGTVQQPPLPVGVDLGLHARATAGGVLLTWRRQHAAGGPLFYHVFRQISHEPGFACFGGDHGGAQDCIVNRTDLGPVRATRFIDKSPLHGERTYVVGVAANWLNDTTQGDVYVLGKPVAVRAP